MLLKKLRLENFRQYRQLNLSFPDGITAIIGPNGAGKSTILEALLWCLFGNRAARTVKEGIKRQTASADDTCRVELDFELGGHAYKLTRSLIGKNNRTEARMLLSDKLDAISPREVDDYIKRLIGLDLKGFLSSFFARQKELNALTDNTPAQRQKHLATMLGVNRLDKAMDDLKLDLKSKKEEISIRRDLQIDPDEIKDRIKTCGEDKDGLEKELTNYQQDIDDGEKQIRAQNETVEELTRRDREYQRLHNEKSILLDRLKIHKKETESSMQELAELDRIEKDIDPLRKSLGNLEQLQKDVKELNRRAAMHQEFVRLRESDGKITEQVKLYSDKLVLTEKEQAGLQDRIADKGEISKNLQESKEQRDELREEYQQLGKQIEVIKSDLGKLENQKLKISELGPSAVCEFCLRPFGQELGDIEKHFNQEILSKKHRLEPLSRKLNEIEQNGKKLKEEILNLSEKQAQLQQVENKLAVLNSEIANLKARIEDLNHQQKNVSERLMEIGDVEFDQQILTDKERELKAKEAEKEKLIRLTEKLSRRPQVEKIRQKAIEEIDNIEKAQAEQEAFLKELDFDPAVFERARKLLSEIKDAASDKKVKLEQIKGRLTAVGAEIKNLTARLDEYARAQEEISRLKGELVYLEKLQLLFGEFRTFLIGRIRPALSKTTSQLFSDMTAGRYQDVTLDKDYNLRLFDRGEMFEVDRFSGGEIDLVNLCFRLAISLEMTAMAGIQQSFIILDEIFGSQDRERQELVMGGLNSLAGRFRQIIIISHIEEIKEWTNNIITVAVDPSGISRAEMSVGNSLRT